MLPFYAVMVLIAVAMVTYIPQISMALRSTGLLMRIHWRHLPPYLLEKEHAENKNYPLALSVLFHVIRKPVLGGDISSWVIIRISLILFMAMIAWA